MLTDPELDLLTELLLDDPTSDVFLQVGEELVRRSRWAEAAHVLRAGLEDSSDTEGWALLARASLEADDPAGALTALQPCSTDPSVNWDASIVCLLALERSGRLASAREQALRILCVDAADITATSALERMEAPPPSRDLRHPDPLVSVDRAERYVGVNRSDRAIRVYRRLIHQFPDDRGLRGRLRQLVAGPGPVLEDDLSEELTDPGMTPPGLRMPSPSMMSGDPTEFADARRIDEEATELLTVEDMDTDPMIQRRNTW